jgi:hypothetical protein
MGGGHAVVQRSHACRKKIPHHFFWKASKLLTNNFTFLGPEFRITGRLKDEYPSGIFNWRHRVVDAQSFVDGISDLPGADRLGRSVFNTQKNTRITSQTRKAIQRVITPISNPTKTVTKVVREGLAFGSLSVGCDSGVASSGCLSEGVGICAF